MDDRTRPDGMTQEEFSEAQRVFEISQQAAEEELWRMACLTASKKDSELFGQTEFQMRDILLRIGARALEAGANQRRKKGGTTEAASPAANAITTPASSSGGPKQS